MIEKLRIVLLIILQINLCNGNVTQIELMNHDEIMLTSRLAFVAFTVDWCPYSVQLYSVFVEAAQKYSEIYPDRQTTWANVNCEYQPRLCARYRIMKFPTVQTFFYGYMMNEYRGSRSVDPLIEYVSNSENPENLVNVQEIASFVESQHTLDQKKSSLIIWFPRESAPYKLMIQAAGLVHGTVNILVPEKKNDLKSERHFLMFSYPPDRFEEYQGMISNFNEIANWVKGKASGLVRELTFLNAEGIIEESKPLLLLFRDPSDSSIDEQYVKAVGRELESDLIEEVNPLITDGYMMTFPLRTLGLSVDDLPILIIDQFVHTYLAPFKGSEIFAEGNIRKFVNDMKNGDLHRRHHGEPQIEEKLEDKKGRAEEKEQTTTTSATTNPLNDIKKVKSIFKNLKPTKKRYSFAKEEL